MNAKIRRAGSGKMEAISPLNATMYYVFPIENFQKHLAPKFLNIDIKRSLQEFNIYVSLFMEKL